jgi:hypothetical protein
MLRSMWRLLRRRDPNDEATFTTAGYSSPPTPEERLDLATISIELGDLAMAKIAEDGTEAQLRSMEEMLEQAQATHDELLAHGVKPAEPGSPRQDKIDWHVNTWKKRAAEAE